MSVRVSWPTSELSIVGMAEGTRLIHDRNSRWAVASCTLIYKQDYNKYTKEYIYIFSYE